MTRSLAGVLVPILLALAIVSTAPVAASAATVASVPPTSEPWVPVTNTDDFFFRQVVSFSLLIRALVFRDYLDLVKVLSGSVQAAGAGNNYSLLLRAADKSGATTGEAIFLECQALPRVPKTGHSGKPLFPECCTRGRIALGEGGLPRVPKRS
jgi:hypothetical protein